MLYISNQSAYRLIFVSLVFGIFPYGLVVAFYKFKGSQDTKKKNDEENESTSKKSFCSWIPYPYKNAEKVEEAEGG